MARTGENIYKRKDGRYEARYIENCDANGKAISRAVYGKSKAEVFSISMLTFTYSKEAGAAFLHDYYNKIENNYFKYLRTVIYRLNDILDDVWNEVHLDKGKHFELSVELIEIAYLLFFMVLGACPVSFAQQQYISTVMFFNI